MNKKLQNTLIFFLIHISFVQGQEYFSMYHMKNQVLQTHNLSPAFLPNKEFMLGLPVLNLKLYTNTQFKIHQIIHKVNDEWTYNIESLYENAKDWNNFVVGASLNVFSFGFQIKKSQLSFMYNLRANGYFNFSKSLLKILKQGLTETINVANNHLESNTYQELALGFKTSFLKQKLIIGLRAKYLNGYTHFSLKNKEIGLKIDEKTGHWILNASDNRFNSVYPKKNGYYNFSSNHGMAADFGLQFKLNKKIDFDFSILDLGFISWKDRIINNKILNDKKDYVYKGFELTNSDSDTKTNLQDLYKYTNDESGYTKNLPIRTYLSGSYKINEKHSFSIATFYNILYPMPSYSLNYQWNTKNIGLGCSGIFDGLSKRFKVGGSFFANMGGFQFYIASDQLLNIGGKILNNYNFNFQLGFNFFLNHFHRKTNDNLMNIFWPSKKKKTKK